MDNLFLTSVDNALEAYLREYEQTTHYAISDMHSKHLGLWHLKQLHLTSEILGRVYGCIKGLSNLDATEKERLIGFLKHLSQKALPLFVAGMHSNPIHHNVQTVENMLLILSHDDSYDYANVKNGLILALLHDVGNGFVDLSLKKVKSSDIKDRQAEFVSQNKPQLEIDEEIEKLIDQATGYRETHMKEGAEIARKLLEEANRSKAILLPTEIEEIVDCIKIHDNPSIAEYYSVLGRQFGKNLLIPLNNDLAYALREADRLWMVSKEGLEKDLFDDLRKGKKPDAFGKLRHNVKRFKNEFRLYETASDVTPNDIEGFKYNTLFRTNGGFALCKRYVSENIAELSLECFGRNIVDI